MSASACPNTMEACNGQISGAWSQGMRRSMEDVSVCWQSEDLSTTVVGICDGHSGDASAKYAAKHVAKRLLKSKDDVTDEELVSECRRIDCEMFESGQDHGSGTTCLMARIKPDDILLLNTGDCRAFIVDLGVMASNFAALTFEDERDTENDLGMAPHDLTNPKDLERIACAGSCVYQQRINGLVNMSHAFGDSQFKQNTALPLEKQPMICDPDVFRVPQLKPGQVMVLCSDGLCPPMSFNGVASVLYQHREQLTKEPARVAQALLTEAIEHCYSRDNVTVYLIQAPTVTIKSTGTPPVMHSSTSLEGAPIVLSESAIPASTILFTPEEQKSAIQKAKERGYPEALAVRTWNSLCSGDVHLQQLKRTFCQIYTSIDNPFIVRPEIRQRIREHLDNHSLTGMYVEHDGQILILNIFLDEENVDHELGVQLAGLFAGGEKWHFCIIDAAGTGIGSCAPIPRH